MLGLKSMYVMIRCKAKTYVVLCAVYIAKDGPCHHTFPKDRILNLGSNQVLENKDNGCTLMAS